LRAVLIADCHVRPASDHHCLAVTLNANQLRSWSSHDFSPFGPCRLRLLC